MNLTAGQASDYQTVAKKGMSQRHRLGIFVLDDAHIYTATSLHTTSHPIHIHTQRYIYTKLYIHTYIHRDTTHTHTKITMQQNQTQSKVSWVCGLKHPESSGVSADCLNMFMIGGWCLSFSRKCFYKLTFQPVFSGRFEAFLCGSIFAKAAFA